MELNSGQEVARSHVDGPMMVLAGPGSGKTTVITHRVRYLIEQHQIDPSEILVITYSKAAAVHMQERYEQLQADRGVSFSTFHGLFFKIIRSYSDVSLENLLREDERLSILKAILVHQHIEWDEDTLNDISMEISYMKNDLIELAHYHSFALTGGDFRAVVTQYEAYKEEHNKIDFDDMLTRCYHLLTENEKLLNIWQRRYKYIMIDEFQDINRIQYQIIKLLSHKNNNIYIVGDDDQSIYKFRGARPDFLLSFPKDFTNAKRALLDINYRSSNEIIKIANSIIKSNTVRYKKVIRGTDRKGRGPVIIKSEDANQEASYIAKKIQALDVPLDDICVVYRTNLQSRAFIDAFSNLNIPFKVKDEAPTIYEHFIAKDLIAYLTLGLDITDSFAFERIINKPKRYISKAILTTFKKEKKPLVEVFLQTDILESWKKRPIEDMVYHLKSLSKMTPYKAIKYIRKTVGYDGYIKEYAAYKRVRTKGLVEVLDELLESAKNFDTIEAFLYHIEHIKEQVDTKKDATGYGVQLSTMHGVKGLEYQVVFVASCVETVIPHEKSQTDEEIEEERRLFYVAVTRAKDLLYISIIKNKYEEKVEPTRFLKGIAYE